MPEIIVRLSILLLVGIIAWLSVTFGKRFVDARRQRALSASLPDTLSSLINTDVATDKARVRILAFSTPDCQQCHRCSGCNRSSARGELWLCQYEAVA